MPFTVNVADRVELCGSFGSLEGTRGKVIEVNLFEHDGREAFEWVTMALETPVLYQGSELTTCSHDSDYFEIVQDGNRQLNQKRRLTYTQKPSQPYDTCDDV